MKNCCHITPKNGFNSLLTRQREREKEKRERVQTEKKDGKKQGDSQDYELYKGMKGKNYFLITELECWPKRGL